MRQIVLLSALAALVAGCHHEAAQTQQPQAAASVPDFVLAAPKQADAPPAKVVVAIDDSASAPTAHADATMQLKTNDPAFANLVAAQAANEAAASAKRAQAAAVAAQQAREQALQAAAQKKVVAHEPVATRHVNLQTLER